MSKRKRRNLGSIYTPTEFARPLVEWGVRDKNEKVLDLGLGEGIFAFLAFERLRILGASIKAATNQIYSSEIHQSTFEAFRKLAEARGLHFQHVYQDDFLNRQFPEVDCVTGNPPYVRRPAIENYELLTKNTEDDLQDYEVSPLSDLYIYFLLRAVSRLKAGGRLAVITADTWLNVRYGEMFKKVLRDNFSVEALISFDRAVFPDAQVKPVLLFATKQRTDPKKNTWFIRAQNGLPPSDLMPLVRRHRNALADTQVKKVKLHQLEPSHTWTKYFESADLLQEINSHSLMTEFENQFRSHIGVQTLANDFFVLPCEDVETLQIEAEFLVPFAHSSQQYKQPVIDRQIVPTHFLFYCSASKRSLYGTKALKYIKAGEKKEVPIRGKGVSVKGYQNKDRIQEDSRPRWYDLRTRLQKQPASPILVPRVFSRNFQVVWNQAQLIAGEPFIECTPKENFKLELELCLAILTNSLIELFVRSDSQLYGGGAYTVSPKHIKQIPVLDLTRINEHQKDLLRQAYRNYVIDPNHDRSIIDTVLYDILGLTEQIRGRITQTLAVLVVISATAKKRVVPNSPHDKSLYS
jgi:tRNA1(Val) A37 N6-methylase TrmN6